MMPTNGVATQELLRRAADGDAHARSELLHGYRDRLKRMIAIRLDKRLAARIDASDIIQETMRDAHRRLPEYLNDPRIPFYPWLRRIASSRLADIYRRHVHAARRSVLREHKWQPEVNDESVDQLAFNVAASGMLPNGEIELAELKTRLREALVELPPHDREILVLRYLEQLGVAEIAAVLDISSTAVTSRHIRALKRLQQFMRSRGDSM